MSASTYYKIRKKSNPELFVKGTPYYRSYDKTGRIFQKIGALRSFITGVMNDPYCDQDFADWEVVELEMVVRGVQELHQVVKPEKILALLKK